MNTPRGLLLTLAAALAVASLALGATPAPVALHGGSHGPRVAALQWLLGGHRPNVYRQIKPTFKWEPNGLYGARTKSAVKAYKFRLGYPQKGQCGALANEVTDTAGQQLFDLLLGKRTRTACQVALAAGRVKAIAAAQPTATALAWKAVLVSWLGLSEQPAGSNRGPCISYSCTWHGTAYPSIQSATGAYGAAWCVSTQQAAAKLVGYGRFADGTAGVYYALDYYAARNLTSAKAKVGALVAFVTYYHGYRVAGTGHMGFVTKVTGTGFSYIAGNDSNGVREHYITFGSRPYAFIYLPNVA